MIVPYGRDARFGSFAIGSSQQQVRPCPLCPGSDQIPQRSEMTRCAMNGHELSLQRGGRLTRWCREAPFALLDRRALERRLSRLAERLRRVMPSTALFVAT